MKKIIITIFSVILAVSGASATNEEEMIRGCHFITEDYGNGDWDNAPTSIYFREDGTCTYSDRRGTLECECYFITCEGKFLHLISSTDFDGDVKTTVINLRFQGFVPTEPFIEEPLISIAPYENVSKRILMRKQHETNHIQTTFLNSKDKSIKHDLRGIKSQEPNGIYISNGKKVVKKYHQVVPQATQ